MNKSVQRSALVALVTMFSLPAVAQDTLNDLMAQKVQSSPKESSEKKDRLLVEAKEIIYNNDKNVVSASGDVELNYQGRTLQADRVSYDRNTRRVYAEGNARITETDGTVFTGSRFELTDDFKTGFIDSLHADTADNTHFSAPRVERTNGETTVFEKGTYTACDACKDNPSKPPFWQVKARRVIHNNEERTIYYEDAQLEFAGIPVAYVPYFWSPDPTVKRKTGFLAPTYIASSSLGTGVSVPFFWAIAPSYDLTLRPSYLSRQGLLMQAEWRQRLMSGAYSIRSAGIFQDDKTAFLPSPLGARDKNFRGSIESNGRFFINDRWQWGWDVALLTDKWFLQNYRIRSESLQSNYFKESVSTVYLTGQGDRSWFDARGFYFKGLSQTDWQKQQPLVHPVVDYNKRFDGSSTFGGEVTVDANLTSLTRSAASFQQIPQQMATLFNFKNLADQSYGLYDTCTVFERGKCLVRGIGGTATRASATLSWRRQLIDPMGQVWTPFAFARADGFWVSPDTSSYQNAQIGNFMNSEDQFTGRIMPGIGLEYRFPLVASLSDWGSQMLEPIAQIVARPGEGRIGRLPNEDAQSLSFDDSNIFEWNKFSGYDRVEGGVRANVGAQYSITNNNGFYANALFGQSFQLAGRNSFKGGDLVNTGLDSGLETRRSDYIGRIQVAPTPNFSIIARGRFDNESFSRKQTEIGVYGSLSPWPLSGAIIYANYAAQPNLGFPRTREGLLTSTTWNINPQWFVNATAVFDLDRYLTDRETFVANYTANPSTAVYNKSPFWTVAGISLGAGYKDECTTFTVTYNSSLKDGATGTKEKSQSVLVKLELRTLGQASFSQNLGSSTTQDGISQ